MFASLLIMMLSFPRSCWLVWWIDWLILTGWEYLGEGWEGRLSVIDVRSALLDPLVDLGPVLLSAKVVLMIMIISNITDILVLFGEKRMFWACSQFTLCNRWWCHMEGASVTMTQGALLDQLVELLSLLLFNFSKKMTKITMILRWWWDGMDGWQKLCGGTGGPRRKVWTRTKKPEHMLFCR